MVKRCDDMPHSKTEQRHEIPGTTVWLVLMKAFRSVKRHALANVAGLDLLLSEFVVLEMLLHKGPQQVNEIGRRIEMTSGAITTAIDRLEARGLVARRLTAEDRRVRLVELTPQGRTLIEAGFARHAEALERATSGLDQEERATLISLLKKLGFAAEELAQGLETQGGRRRSTSMGGRSVPG